MGYGAKILKDSLSPDGVRLTTMEVTFPRIVLAEFNTHRMFSRNSASSRAIPVEKMLKKVDEDPFIPIYWGKNQKGMQAEQELSDEDQEYARDCWLRGRDYAVDTAKRMLDMGIHKQITNRMLEPWLWQTVIVTATEWDNFWGLRCHKDAQPEIRVVADMMRKVYDESTPDVLAYGQWHLPLLQDDEFVDEDVGFPCVSFTAKDAVKACVGRCARISYLTHDGKRDPKADIEMAERLAAAGHMSPWEHVARPMHKDEIKTYSTLDPRHYPGDGVILNEVPFLGNFRGWVQARKELPNEYNFLKTK